MLIRLFVCRNVSKMKFCALISGGKDSIYAIQQACKYGHTLMCAAHLALPEQTQELDSFMYQSAASSVVPTLTTKCLGVPAII